MVDQPILLSAETPGPPVLEVMLGAQRSSATLVQVVCLCLLAVCSDLVSSQDVSLYIAPEEFARLTG